MVAMADAVDDFGVAMGAVPDEPWRRARSRGDGRRRKMPVFTGFSVGGAGRDRTADLLIAKRERFEVARRQWTA
jgi:hypothetical protein